MTDRERMIDLIGKFASGPMSATEALANYLIANGVTFATETNVGSKWISVEDRLPEVDVTVLTIVTGKPHPNVTLINAYELGEYDPEGWILEMWPEWMDAKVSYWMPLPEPPEEVEHD